ncbi:MAG: uracil phosphoribosyltransferase, partial [Myxococcota bacterium]|nr:uracil phosphoribosyltransferase [Myxococcota bacterium]
MKETAYVRSNYRPPEIEHRYGPNVHLLDDPLAWTRLARFSAQDTRQPEVGRLLRELYEPLAHAVVAAELPRARFDVPTRMVTSSPQAAVVRTAGIATNTRVVTVGIARAGTIPSQIVYDLLNGLLDPSCVRQDHLFMSRTTDSQG